MEYTVTQTVESLMDAFDTEYNSRRPNAKSDSMPKIREIKENAKDPRIDQIQKRFFDKTISTEDYINSFDGSWKEYIAFSTDKKTGKRRVLEYTLGDVDVKYPRGEWIQMLLNKGVTIQSYKAYDEYLSIRVGLFARDFDAEEGSDNGKHEDYIDKEIRTYQLINDARIANPNVENWTVIGENAFPSISGRMYVGKTQSGLKIKSYKTSNGKPKLSEEQKVDLQNNGIEPIGWDVVYLDENGNVVVVN